MLLSSTEENYLKAIFSLSEKTPEDPVNTNAIAEQLQTTAASVTDMLKRLQEKELIAYEKYKGARLSEKGRLAATQLVRKHRLWETFMVEKLGFSWDTVHPVAEQLEHIQSEELIDRLEAFLDYPKFDPHGDPIPDRQGNFAYQTQIPLSELPLGQKAEIVGVSDHSPAFLRYVQQLNLILGTELVILERFEFDDSLRVQMSGFKDSLLITPKVSQLLFVKVER